MMEVHPYKDNNYFFQIDLHEGLYFPVPPSPFPVPLPGWHFGNGRLSWGFFGHADNGGTVLADGARLISQGHQVNMVVVLHSNIPPLPPGLDILTPLLLLGSSNESNFACMSVLGPDGPIAVAVGLWGRVGVNIACNDPWNLPTSAVYTNGTVRLGFTWADFGAGLISGLTSVAMDRIFRSVAEEFGKFIPKSFKSKLGMFYHRLIKNVPGLEGVGAGVFNQKAVPGILGKMTGMTSGLPGFQSIPRAVFDGAFETGAVNAMSLVSEHLSDD